MTITRARAEQLISAIKKHLPAGIEIELVGSIAKRGESNKDIDLKLTADASKLGDYLDEQPWWNALEQAGMQLHDAEATWDDPTTGEQVGMEEWEWQGIIVDVFPVWINEASLASLLPDLAPGVYLHGTSKQNADSILKHGYKSKIDRGTFDKHLEELLEHFPEVERQPYLSFLPDHAYTADDSLFKKFLGLWHKHVGHETIVWVTEASDKNHGYDDLEVYLEVQFPPGCKVAALGLDGGLGVWCPQDPLPASCFSLYQSTEAAAPQVSWFKRTTSDGFDIVFQEGDAEPPEDLNDTDGIASASISSREPNEIEIDSIGLRESVREVTVLDNLWVDKNHRGKGLSKLTLNTALSEIKRVYPNQPVILWASQLEDLPVQALVKLYERAGFKVATEWDGEGSDMRDEILMWMESPAATKTVSGLNGDWKKEGYDVQCFTSHQEAVDFIKAHSTSIPSVFPENVPGSYNAYAVKGGEIVGFAHFAKVNDGELTAVQLQVLDPHKRKGLATAMYEAMKEKTGLEIKQSNNLSEDGKAFRERLKNSAVAAVPRDIKVQVLHHGEAVKQYPQLFKNQPIEWGAVATNSHGEVVGYARFTEIGDYLQCFGTQVSNDYQRMGIATEMYVQAEKRTKKILIPDEDQSEDAEKLWAQPNRPFGNDVEAVTAGLLDYPRKKLPDDVWLYDGEPLPRLQPKLRATILAEARHRLKKFGAKLVGVMLYGGAATYQYKEGGDIDVSLYINWNEVKVDPEIMESAFKHVEIPWGKYVLHLFVKPPTQQQQVEVADAVYDVMNDEWKMPPLVLPKGFDPETFFRPMLEIAEKKAQKFDVMIGEVAREWTRLKKALRALKEGARDEFVIREKISVIRSVLLHKIDDVSEEFTKIWVARRKLHDDLRKRYVSDPDVGRYERFQLPEVIWKYLDEMGYAEFLKVLAKAHEAKVVERLIDDAIGDSGEV